MLICSWPSCSVVACRLAGKDFVRAVLLLQGCRGTEGVLRDLRESGAWLRGPYFWCAACCSTGKLLAERTLKACMGHHYWCRGGFAPYQGISIC